MGRSEGKQGSQSTWHSRINTLYSGGLQPLWGRGGRGWGAENRVSVCLWVEGSLVGLMRLRPKFVPNHQHRQVLLMICKLTETQLGALPLPGGTPSHILGHFVQCLAPHQPWNSLRATHSPPRGVPQNPLHRPDTTCISSPDTLADWRCLENLITMPVSIQSEPKRPCSQVAVLKVTPCPLSLRTQGQ